MNMNKRLKLKIKEYGYTEEQIEEMTLAELYEILEQDE